ncbi:MAG: SulP family inorganic anion transporter, partial [Planctomycetes bacterium]|nr:SulP family inorganic anion transporter [Planctomycetota bacterium]
AGRGAMLVSILWGTVTHVASVRGDAAIMSLATLVLVLTLARIGPRVPAAFLALVAGGAAIALLDRFGVQASLPGIGGLQWEWPSQLTPLAQPPYQTDLFVGAGAIAMVGIIQSLAIAKGIAGRNGERISPKRELWALGAANVACSAFQGFPGSGSFARSALCDLAGARTRLSGIFAAVATALIVAVGAGLAHYVTNAAIAGLLIATAVSMVDWREFLHVLRHDRHDRIVLGTTMTCVFFLPIHWAVLLGLAVSIAVFLRRVSTLHLVEMVAGESQQQFTEHAIDGATGESAVTMLQVEGPLFFAHADELAERLETVLGRGPRVLILRMRRTQQLDFSVIVLLDRVIRDYLARGGRVILCGLQPELRRTLRDSPLGQTLPPEYMLQTTREVFGSAHLAIELAEQIAWPEGAAGRPIYRTVQRA